MPGIAVRGEDVLIDVTITDPVLADLLKPLKERDRLERFSDVAEIGARVLIREQAGEQIDWIKAEFDRIARETLERMTDLFSADGSENPLAAFQQGATEALQLMTTEISRSMTAMAAGIEGLRAERAGEVDLEAERERGSAKGLIFEEEISAAIDGIASGGGDVCDHVGANLGATGRSGDVLVEIDAAAGTSKGRIIFEVKSGKIFKPEAVRQLDAALENHQADYAVLVVRGLERVPTGMHPLREFNGNKMVCALLDDATVATLQLETAYALARARVTAAAKGDELTSSRVIEAVERCLSALDDLRRVKAAINGAQASLENAKALTETILAAARQQLQELADLAAAE